MLFFFYPTLVLCIVYWYVRLRIIHPVLYRSNLTVIVDASANQGLWKSLVTALPVKILMNAYPVPHAPLLLSNVAILSVATGKQELSLHSNCAI